jgi:hypothetical protein
VDAGGVDSNNVDINNYFNLKTTQLSNKLDTQTIDIGYHYDQNAPYVQVLSPSDSNTLTGTQTIDFNVESGYGTAAGLTARLAYATTAQTSPSGGTQIVSQALSSYSCSAGPVFKCSYTWDTTTVSDGNYYITLAGTDSNGSRVDNSDNNFQIAQNSAPTISVLEPDGVGDSASTDFNIVWQAADPDLSDSLITSCYADTDAVGYTQTQTCFGNVDTNRDQNNSRMCDLSSWDAGDYYIWCTVNDQKGAGNSTASDYSPGYLTQAIVGLGLYNPDLNLGTLFILDSNASEGNDRNGFWVENVGNVDVNVALEGTTLFVTQSGTSAYYTYKISDIENGSSATGNQSAYSPIPIGVSQNAVDSLQYEDVDDLIRVDVNVTVPSGEGAGTRTSTLTMLATQA